MRKKLEGKYQFKGTSDSEIIGALYQEYGLKMFEHLDGMWAFIIYDKKNDTFMAARDHVGIIPVYVGIGKNGEKYVSSELKAISHDCVSIDILKPGHYITQDWVQTEWYHPEWYNMDVIPRKPLDLGELERQFTEAVREQLMGDVPFGLLISGGVDSSLAAAISMR